MTTYKTIADLPAASSASAADLFEVSQGGVSRRITAGQLLAGDGTLDAGDYGLLPSASGPANSAALVAAIAAAMAQQKELLIAGGNYALDNTTITITITAPLTITGQAGLTRFVGSNLTQIIFQTPDHPWTAVSAITQVTTPVSVIPTRTRLTVASTAGYAAGDLIGIVSNNHMNSTTASSAYYGEPALVDEVDSGSNFIYTVGELVDATLYTTTPSIRRFDRHKLNISGLTMAPAGDTNDAGITARARGAIWLRGCYRPQAEVHFENAYAECLLASWCWHGQFHSTVDQAANIPTSGGFGYCGIDSGGNYGNDWTVHAERARHAWTSGGNRNVPFVLGGEDVWLFGGPKFSVVRGVASHMYHAAWDSHGDSFGTFFEHVTAQYDVSSPSHYDVSTSAGVQLRGRRERVGTAVVYGSQDGVRLSVNEGAATNDQDQYVYIDNLTFTGGDFVFCHAIHIAPVGSAPWRYRVVANSVRTDKCEHAVYVGVGGWARIHHLDAAGMVTGLGRIDDGGYLAIEDGVFDYTPEARTIGLAGISLEGTSACDLAGGRFILPSSILVFNRGSTPGTKTTRLGDIQSNLLITSINDGNAEWAHSRMRVVGPSFDMLNVRVGDSGRAWNTNAAHRAILESTTDCIVDLVAQDTGKSFVYFSRTATSAAGRIQYDHTNNQLAFFRNGSLTLTLGAGFATVAGRLNTSAVTVTGLGTAASAGTGARWWATDSTVVATGNFGNVVVGGGANGVPVYSDGTSWRIG